MILEKLFQVQKEFEILNKDAENPFYKSVYLPLEEILKHFLPVFNKYDVLCYHFIKGKILTTRICLKNDKEDFIESEFEIINTDPQKRGSEITYGRRYNLLALLNIVAEEDDDGNKATNQKPKTGVSVTEAKEVFEKPKLSKSTDGNCPACGKDTSNTKEGITKTGKSYKVGLCECGEKFFIN